MVGHPKHVPKVLAAGVDIVCAQAGEAGEAPSEGVDYSAVASPFVAIDVQKFLDIDASFNHNSSQTDRAPPTCQNVSYHYIFTMYTVC